MSYSDHTITYPVSRYDISEALGNASIDLGTLCQSPTINKWARFKPVKNNLINTYGQLTSSKVWASDATWNIGSFRGERYGMTFPTPANSTSVTVTTGTGSLSGQSIRRPISGSFFDKLIRNQLRWTYNPPIGTSSSPFRILDFVQYIDNAPCPLPKTTSKTSSRSGNNCTYFADCDVESINDVDLLGLNLDTISTGIGSVPSLSTMYLGVLFYKTSSDGGGDDVFWQCSTFPIGNIIAPTSSVPRENQLKALRISISNSEFATKIDSTQGNKWNTRAFLCSKALGWCEQLYGNENPLGYLIPCDEDPAETSFVTTGTVQITKFRAIKLGLNVRVTVELTNYTGSTVTIGTSSTSDNDPSISILSSNDSWTQKLAYQTGVTANSSVSFEYTFNQVIEGYDTAKFYATYKIGSGTTVYTIDESHPISVKPYNTDNTI